MSCGGTQTILTATVFSWGGRTAAPMHRVGPSPSVRAEIREVHGTAEPTLALSVVARLRHVGQRTERHAPVRNFRRRLRAVNSAWRPPVRGNRRASDKRHGRRRRESHQSSPPAPLPSLARPSPQGELIKAWQVVAGFKSKIRAAPGTPSTAWWYRFHHRPTVPKPKYRWVHLESSTRVGPFQPMMDMGSAFVCERGSSLRPFVAWAARSPTFLSTCPRPSTA